jgi:hypothetical protein
MKMTIKAASVFALVGITMLSSISRGQVMIADVDVTGTNNATTVTTVIRQSAGFDLVTGQGNEGDISLSAGGNPLRQEDGIILATPNTIAIPPPASTNVNPRAFVSVAGPVTHANSFSGAAWLAMTDITGGGTETNFPVDLAFFPFADGWVGGHIDADGTKLAGNLDDVTVTANDAAVPITYTVSIDGISPSTTGMLFTIDASNENSGNHTTTAIVGDSWEVSVYDQGADFPPPGGSAGIPALNEFSFVFIPDAAPNLIGGWINDDASTIRGVGDFDVESLATTGEYLLKISDGAGGFLSDEDGVLLLNVTKHATKAGNFGPDDNFLVYEYEAANDGFHVVSSDLAGASDQTTQWSFAFLRYDAPIQFVVPEPSSMVMFLVGVIALLPARGRRGA